MFRFEHKSHALAPTGIFLNRLFRYLLFSIGILFFSLMIGILGYHFLCGMSWLDSLVNASMILSGMGPVNIITGDLGKLFESAYALYSGVAFLSTIALLFTPILHRIMHRIHLDNPD
jgi:hypothetical protein